MAKIKLSNLKGLGITRIAQNLIISPSHRNNFAKVWSGLGIGGLTTEVYQRGLDLVIVAHPGYKEKKCGEGVITGIKVQDVVKEDILKKIISLYVFSHLSKCCHQNQVYLH